MRFAFASLALVCLAFTAGCGDSTPPPMPAGMVGSYIVNIDGNNMTDQNITMTVSLASGTGVLLDFATGISQVRCSVVGANILSLPRQMIEVGHAIGAATGTATGDGTIDNMGAVDLTIHLQTAGIVGSDGGVGSDVDYHITGTKN